MRTKKVDVTLCGDFVTDEYTIITKSSLNKITKIDLFNAYTEAVEIIDALVDLVEECNNENDNDQMTNEIIDLKSEIEAKDFTIKKLLELKRNQTTRLRELESEYKQLEEEENSASMLITQLNEELNITKETLKLHMRNKKMNF